MPQQPSGWTLVQPASTAPEAWTPVQTPPPDKSWLDSLGDYFSEALSGVNPKNIIQGVNQAVLHPITTVQAIGQAQGDVARQAEESFKKGDYAKGAAQVIHYLLPIIGPRLEQARGDFERGDVAKGLGATTDAALQVVGPEVAARGVSAARNAIPRLPAPSPELAEAVAFANREGIPVDAATATGSDVVRSVQKRVGDSMGGAGAAERFKAAQTSRLATVGDQLAEKANARPLVGPLKPGEPRPTVGGPAVTPEQAGAQARNLVANRVTDLDAAADVSYGRLRGIADQNQENVLVRSPAAAADDAPGSFTMRGNALPDEVFDAAYADAKQNGYTGTRTDLRKRFDDELSSGLRGHEERAAIEKEYGPEALLSSIRELGGIKPFVKEIGSGRELRGDFSSIVESFGAKSTWGQKGGASIFRTKGLGLDDMVDQLHQDPRWKSVISDENDLLDALDEIARKGPTEARKPSVEEALAITNVRPGAQWWVKPVEETQAIPVDLRPVREQLRPLYDGLMRERELNGVMMGDKSRALVALDSLMRAGDYAPLETVDRALSDIKSLARGDGGLPALRTAGQGAAGQTVKVLDDAVRQAAAIAGPDAVRALEAGRSATRAKYVAADVLKGLEGEPVGAFNRLTSRGDASIAQLRDVAKQAPEAVPQIARAVLDGLMDQATIDGGFGHAAAVRAKWQKLGPQTKQLLFPDVKLRTDVDSFFRLAAKIAENPNPSGTARINNLFNWTSSVIGFPVARLLYSPEGVKLLTQGLTMPPSQTAINLWMARVRKLAPTIQAAGRVGQLQPAGPPQ